MIPLNLSGRAVNNEKMKIMNNEILSKHEILKINPAEAAGLIGELDYYLTDLYPPESNHLESIEDLSRKNVRMFGCKIKNEIIAIGAVKLMDTYGELKRLYVSPHYRGKKIASEIMERLEFEIQNNNLDFARFETGIHQPEAIALFKKYGYTMCKPFGNYIEDPLSIFMEKRLQPTKKSR
jgi:putative acetyltransferase